MIEPESPSSPSDDETFVPPSKHAAVDRAGKALINLAGSIGKVAGAADEPIVVNRKAGHVSFKSLEDLIDKALEGSPQIACDEGGPGAR